MNARHPAQCLQVANTHTHTLTSLLLLLLLLLFLLFPTADMDLALVGAHVTHTTAQLAMEGEYSEARVKAMANQRLLQRNR